MQARTSEPPNLTFASFMTAQLGILAIVASGGWTLYQSAITHIDKSAETTIELVTARLEAKIEANSALIRRNTTLIERNTALIERNAALIEHNGGLIRGNGEHIAQLRERMAAVEARIGALETVVRFFHPPEEDQQTEP